MKIKNALWILPLMLLANVALATPCLDLRSTFMTSVQDQLVESCRALSGEPIHPEKRSMLRQAIEGVWDSGATVDCVATCGASQSCFARYARVMTQAALDEVIPLLTVEWCTTGV